MRKSSPLALGVIILILGLIPFAFSFIGITLDSRFQTHGVGQLASIEVTTDGAKLVSYKIAEDTYSKVVYDSDLDSLTTGDTVGIIYDKDRPESFIIASELDGVVSKDLLFKGIGGLLLFGSVVLFLVAASRKIKEL